MPAPTYEQREKTRLAALRLLETRARSRAELTERLLARKLPRIAVEEIVERLCEVGLVNDEQLARHVIESENRARPAGEALLRHRLDRHRVDADAAERAIESVNDTETDRERAHRLAHALAARLPEKLTGVARHRRLAAALARRGFDEETTIDAVESVLGSLDDAAD